MFLALIRFREPGSSEWRLRTMATDQRDLLELLMNELEFIETGGYRQSIPSWLRTSVFQDSLTCINYGYPYRAHPCNECHLLDFVGPEHQYEVVPCHHIPLDQAGETIENLENIEDQGKLERKVRDWLRFRIREIEEQRATQAVA